MLGHVQIKGQNARPVAVCFGGECILLAWRGATVPAPLAAPSTSLESLQQAPVHE